MGIKWHLTPSARVKPFIASMTSAAVLIVRINPDGRLTTR
jgi:hypothetical protein